MLRKIYKKLTYSQFLALGFMVVILSGTFLLCLPVSSKTGNWTDPLTALFTATSSTCVTGLAVKDTYLYWSRFGQIVLLFLIQIGGLGFMSIFTIFSVFLKKKISLGERKILVQISGNMRYHGVVSMMKKIIFGTFLIEGLGALVLSFRFCREMPFGEGLFYSVFHSVSAFCNAGFDLMSQFSSETSFSSYSGDWLVNLTLMSLIITGGIGFLVWDDFEKHRFNFRNYCLHSKLAVLSSAILLSFGFVFFLVSEWNASFSEMSVPEKILAAMFQSTTTRTAGFCTVPQNELSEAGKLFTSVFMFIGGSPASTAGGVKTTTILVVILSSIASARHIRNVTIFKKRIAENVVHQATSISTIYLCAIILSCAIMTIIEPFSLSDMLYETVSAVGTVGLSVGITAELTVFSKLLLILLMFFGRIGGLSLVLVLAEKQTPIFTERPVENILIG